MKRIALFILACAAVFFTLNAQSTKVLMKTSMGDITLMLYDDTPMHKENFIKLVNDKFYDGLLFHRTKPGFMIQGGDPTSRNAEPGTRLGSGGPGYRIPAEFRAGHYHKKGALATARQGDGSNPQKESNGSQFYIVHGEKWTAAQLNAIESQGGFKYTDEQRKQYIETGGYAPLDYQYTVFGEVTSGLEVVDKIANVERDAALRPLQDVKIISMRIIE